MFLPAAVFALHAQTIAVYSEFQRPDPFGGIVEADRSLNPREMLSPGVARNSYISFHVAITGPPNSNYFLFAATNPPNILTTTIYKEQFVQSGGRWIPDTLESTREPRFGVIPDAQIAIAGQTTRCYLVDIWAPPDAEIGRRVRLEIQMKTGRWVVYPLEIRILRARVPDAQTFTGLDPIPPPERPADFFALAPLARYLSRAAMPPYRQPDTVRAVIERNAQQDMRLAVQLNAPDVWMLALRETTAPSTMGLGAEWFLRLRDLLYRRAQ